MVIRPFSTPKASSRTFTMGTKQLVVHEAFDTTVWAAGSNSSSLTPTTKVASAPEHGAETSTRGAPPSRWRAAAPRLVKMPVDSTTTSTPRSPHGRSSGLRTDRTLMRPRPLAACRRRLTRRRPAAVDRVAAQQMGHRVDRSEIVDGHHVDARALDPGGPVEVRPMRPKPLIPTRMLMGQRLGRGGRRPGGCPVREAVSTCRCRGAPPRARGPWRPAPWRSARSPQPSGAGRRCSRRQP